MGLCLILSEESKDADSLFESAVQTYFDQQKPDYALRTVLMFYEAAKCNFW